MFDRLAYAATIVSSSVRAFGRFPSLFVALLFVWAALTGLAGVFLTHLEWLDTDSPVVLGAIGFGCFVVGGVLLSFASFILLERVRQIEMDEPRSMSGALGDAVANTIRALPLIAIWSVLWLLIQILSYFLGSDDDDEPTGSWWGFSLSALCDAMRMFVFLALPAFAWEAETGPIQAIRRAAGVAKTFKVEFAAGFVLSEVAGWLATIPTFALLVFEAESNGDLSVVVAIALSVLGWSFVMLVQQMFAAELYAWYLVWEDACERSRREGTVPPSPADVRRPSVIDGVADLVAVGT